MPKVKIAIIGGGSYGWTFTIVRDLVVTGDLEGSTIVLEDIDPKALGIEQVCGMQQCLLRPAHDQPGDDLQGRHRFPAAATPGGCPLLLFFADCLRHSHPYLGRN